MKSGGSARRMATAIAGVLLVGCFWVASTAAAAEVDPRPGDLVADALEGWSEYASAGDATALEPAFAPGGPQWRQLTSEAPVGGPPLEFELLETVVRTSGSSAATVWGRVRVSRVGFRSEVFGWDFDLVRTGDGWRVWTVVAADRPAAAAPSTTTSTRPTADPPAPPVAAPAPTAPDPVPQGVRLPALSAWIIVVTVAGVALAGYLAPRWERREP